MLEINTQTASSNEIEDFMTSAIMCFAGHPNNKIPCKINSEDWVIQHSKSLTSDNPMYYFTKGTVESVNQAIADFNRQSEDTYTEKKIAGYDEFFTHIRADGSTKRGAGAVMDLHQAVIALSFYKGY